MTEEHITLHSVIEKAVGDFCVQNGGGFPVAYVAIVEMMNSDGQSRMVATSPTEQQIYRSMGLLQYAGAWYLSDAQSMWARDNDSED